VDQAAEAIDALDWSGGVARRLERDGYIEVDSPVGPGLVVVGDELGQHPFKMVMAEDEHPVVGITEDPAATITEIPQL